MVQIVPRLLSVQGSAWFDGVIKDRQPPVKHVPRAQIILLSADRLPVLAPGVTRLSANAFLSAAAGLILILIRRSLGHDVSNGASVGSRSAMTLLRSSNTKSNWVERLPQRHAS